MDDLIISMLALAEQLSTGDFIIVDIPDESSETGYATRKITTNALFIYFLTQVLFTSSLNTSVKTITGAINEVDDHTDAALSAIEAINEEVEAIAAYNVGETIDLEGVMITGYAEGGTLKAFLPLQRPLIPGTIAEISGNWNIRGSVEDDAVTLSSLGTVVVTDSELGLSIEITTQDTSAAGLFILEGVTAQITFTQEA